MGSKTNTTTATGLPALQIGARVRRIEDRVAGRIVWANGVSVKITWEDGEQVTWRRDSLAGRPIEILGLDEDEAAAPSSVAAAPTEPSEEKPQRKTAAPEATADEQESPTPEAKDAAETASTVAEPTPRAAEAAAESEPVPTTGKPQRRRKTSLAPQEKKLSALDAAAKVLAETRQAMTCQELIGAMAAKEYWTSPGGKTPSATLYSALLREVTTKGDQAHFTKAEPGKFDLAVRG